MSVKLIIVSIALWVWTGLAAAAGVADRLAGPDGWVSWNVAMIDGVALPCCWGQHGKTRGNKACDLDARSWSWGSSSGDPRSQGDRLTIYARVDAGKIDRLRAYAAQCPVVANRPVRTLDPVSDVETVAWLRGRAVEVATTSKDLADSAISTLAFLVDAGATRALSELVDSDAIRKDARESALFWLAQNRGAQGAAVVEHFARGKADPELRAHALFALSQSSLPEAYLRVRDIGAADAAEHVRSQALFWMAQMEDPRAHDDILAVLRRETDEDVQEQAVFALSQLSHGAADPALIAVVRGTYPRSVKQRALFWLGQSGSDQALAFLDEVLGGDSAAAR